MTDTEFWRARGAVLRGEGSAQRVVHLGDPEAEARRAQAGEGTALVPLLGAAPLRLTGPDRASFLHGQLSNAVQGLPAGACNHTLQLNARGQVVGEAVLCVRRDDLFLSVDDGCGPQVLASLEAHIVFDEVRVEDLSGTLAALTVQGPGAAEAVRRAFGELPHEGRFAQCAFGSAGEGAAGVLLVRRRRSAAGGVDVHLLARQLPEAVEALMAAGARPAGEAALDLMRVVAALPSAAREGAGGALPQELDLASAVSFRKGCYLGQEIMARIEARGAVRKGPARLRLTAAAAGEAGGAGAAAALEGLALRQGGREVGRLGTVAALPQGGLAALAVLRRELPAGGGLVVADGEAEVARAEPWPLPEAERGAGAASGSAPDGTPGARDVQPEGASDPGL
ncbi:MAG TPA: hypothetical protein VKB31_06865 [Trueperaceae bacterium]|nr:hypothetical protein [Trueperaceae bacterium]